MANYEDDWMNPKPFKVWTSSEPKKGEIEYLIERKQAIPVSGNVSHIYRWTFWSSHKTAEERDQEIKRLSEQNPMWHLRARNRDAWAEYHGIFPPDSYPGINP